MRKPYPLEIDAFCTLAGEHWPRRFQDMEAPAIVTGKITKDGAVYLQTEDGTAYRLSLTRVSPLVFSD